MDLPAGAMVSAIALETHHERYRPLDPHRLRDAHEHPPRTTTRESLQEALHAFYASLTNSKDQEWNEEGWSKDFIEGWVKSHQKKILPMRSMPRIQRKEDPEGSGRFSALDVRFHMKRCSRRSSKEFQPTT